MRNNVELVAGIYLVLGSLFLLALFIGALTTLARVIYIRAKRRFYPTLLTRDLVTVGGLALSFALITGIRFLPAEERAAITTGNVWWALGSTVPAVIGIVTYVYFELFVIKLADEADPPPDLALEASVQENIELTKEAKVAADAAFEVANHSNEKIAALTELVAGKEDKPVAET